LPEPALVAKLREREDVFGWFLDNICACVVGKEMAKKEAAIKLPSEWMTPTQEAFALLCVENYYDMMVDQHNRVPDPATPVWTDGGRGKRRGQGWDQHGITRYNSLVHLVNSDRSKNRAVEERYMHQKRRALRDALEEKRRVEMERRKERERGMYAAVDDFSSSDEDEDENQVA
jgi:hypothetical protein